MALKCLFLYWKAVLNTHSLYERAPSASLCVEDIIGTPFKTENNKCLANSYQPLEFCLSAGQIIAPSLHICRNQTIRGLSLVISLFMWSPPVSVLFLFTSRFKVHLKLLVLWAPWTGSMEIKPSRQNPPGRGGRLW